MIEFGRRSAGKLSGDPVASRVSLINSNFSRQASNIGIAGRAIYGYVHSIVCEEPVHHVLNRRDEPGLRDFLSGLGFAVLSAWRFQQVFKPGCRWGAALDMNPRHQLHVRCFSLGRGYVFLNAHWEYHRRYPSLHFGIPHDWDRGRAVFDGLMNDFYTWKESVTKGGRDGEGSMAQIGVPHARVTPL